MEFSGKIKAISNDYITNETLITFSVNEKSALNEYEKLRGCEKLKITAVKYRNKRSLDANAYMWVLLQKMAEVLHTSKDELYLEMLSKYGVYTHMIVKPNAVERTMQIWRTARVLGEVTVNGQTGIQLQCYYGSSTYDTKEMSFLIDRVVDECKELGIETLPPAELEEMKRMWASYEKVV
jgi:hypothetical protein